MRITVNPNRMELLRLRKRLFLARRGHKLLKDKQEELMKRFLSLIEESKGLREEIEEKLKTAYRNLLSARGVMSEETLESALLLPAGKLTVNHEIVPVMNLRLPRFELKEKDGEMFGYGPVSVSADLDLSISLFSKVLPSLIKLAEIEKWVDLMADEIERTRRRVNALEYILIPDLENVIRSISMKLSERERGNLTRLMKVKDMMK